MRVKHLRGQAAGMELADYHPKLARDPRKQLFVLRPEPGKVYVLDLDAARGLSRQLDSCLSGYWEKQLAG